MPRAACHMTAPSFVAYYRVSTASQTRSGLGIEAQRESVRGYVAGRGGSVLAEFFETETGKGANALLVRPQLRASLAICKERSATLLIAKLDRLARNAHFITGLIESGVTFIAVDMPNAEKFQLQIFAAMAEWERDQISARTKAALAAARSRGVALGTAGKNNLACANSKRFSQVTAFYGELRDTFSSYSKMGLSKRQIAAALNANCVHAPRGGQWTRRQVQRAFARFEERGSPDFREPRRHIKVL